MHCPHCRAVNDEAGERCVHCGRRLNGDAPGPFPLRSGNAITSTATAPALDLFADSEPVQAQPPETPKYQPSLFRDGTAGSKVIPIPTLTPLHPYHRDTHRDTSRAAAQRRSSPRPTSPNRPQYRRSGSQQDHLQRSLGFQDSPPEVRVQPGETIDCDAPVAAPTHRLMAAAVDGSLILVGVGVFLAIFFVSGGQVTLDRQALSFVVGVTVVIALFYRALWCLANGDSPGMRFAGLRLVDFDGRKPDREQRGVRQVASLLSLLSAGLGLVWALVDEENLTWHDHISKTFPTTRIPD
jgi:uncharacterized RDD family membrane protein YckC